jgi:nucleoside-diphosphate-sugar epimerase
VTGAAGFIGSHLAESLQEQGHDVVGLDTFTDYYDAVRKEENARGLDLRRIDLAEDHLDFAGFDGIFHLAGQPGVRSFGSVFADYLRRNLLATQRVFEAAATAGVRVVFTSSSSVYGDAETYPTPEETPTRPISPYGITKLGCEHLVRAYATSFGLDAVVLRYFTVYGPRQRPDMAFTRMVEALASGSPWELYGDGTRSRSFTYVSDAVEATIVAMERGSGTYNVGGGEEATMNEVMELLEHVAGRTLDVRRMPEAAGDVRRTKADITRIRSELDWEPRVALADGLRSQWEWAFGRVGAR